MWDKLLKIFEETKNEEEIPASIAKRDARKQQLEKETSQQSQVPLEKNEKGQGVLIGYNYLKGLDEDYEDSSKNLRRFINLNNLLRGRYSGKVESDTAETQSDIRGEDSE